MILGILSDSHGHRRRTRRAIELLETCGTTAFVHCGDFGEPDLVDEMVGRRCWFVWGNNDEPIREYERYALSVGVQPPPRELPVRFELEGKRFAVCHGHEPWFGDAWSGARFSESGAAVNSALAADYVMYGHLHAAADELLGGVRFINPGALHRAPFYSVATLDLATGRCRFWNVPRGDEESSPPPPVEIHL